MPYSNLCQHWVQSTVNWRQFLNGVHRSNRDDHKKYFLCERAWEVRNWPGGQILWFLKSGIFGRKRSRVNWSNKEMYITFLSICAWVGLGEWAYFTDWGGWDYDTRGRLTMPLVIDAICNEMTNAQSLRRRRVKLRYAISPIWFDVMPLKSSRYIVLLYCAGDRRATWNAVLN